MWLITKGGIDGPYTYITPNSPYTVHIQAKEYGTNSAILFALKLTDEEVAQWLENNNEEVRK